MESGGGGGGGCEFGCKVRGPVVGLCVAGGVGVLSGGGIGSRERIGSIMRLLPLLTRLVGGEVVGDVLVERLLRVIGLALTCCCCCCYWSEAMLWAI